MKAAYIRRYGAQEKLEIGELPAPTPGDNDVLVAVRAASVSPVDYRVRNGALRAIRRYTFPLILGHDLAGVVVAVGSRVTKFKLGDEVYGRPSARGIGAFAELIAVDQNELAHKPANLSFAEAASLPLVGLTAWQALVELADVRQGQNVLIHAGSGGVGTFAIQLAKYLGATVTTTTSTKNINALKALGADKVIDYSKEDFTWIAAQQQLILAPIDGESLYRSFELLAPGGMLVSLTGAPDGITARELGLGWPLRLMLNIKSYRARKAARDCQATYRFLMMKASGAQLQRITALVEGGEIRPVIEKILPFHAVQEAIDHCESGRTRGKVVIAVSDDSCTLA